MSDVYLNFIHGQWKQGTSGQWDENRNPAKPSDLIGKATRSTPNDIDRAIDAAQKAQGEWARMPRPKRGAILAKAATLLKGQTRNLRKNHHPGRREKPVRGTRRSSKSNQLPRIHGWRIAPSHRPSHPVRSTGHDDLHHAGPARSGGHHHAVELPRVHPRLENRSSAGGGKLHRFQTRLQHARVCDPRGAAV
jgi:hypothetical protein